MRKRAAPAGHGAVRAGGGQGCDDRLHDFLAAMVGAERDGGAGEGPHHGACLAIIVTGRKAPSFFGVCGSIR